MSDSLQYLHFPNFFPLFIGVGGLGDGGVNADYDRNFKRVSVIFLPLSYTWKGDVVLTSTIATSHSIAIKNRAIILGNAEPCQSLVNVCSHETNRKHDYFLLES